jgi:hypothetical protein
MLPKLDLALCACLEISSSGYLAHQDLAIKSNSSFFLVFTPNEDTGQDLSAFDVQLLQILVQDSSPQSILAHHSFQSR